MARAKKTDRAEARRRYRAERPADVGEADDGDAAPAPSTRATRASTPAYTTPGGRVGIGTAFRTAFHPVNVREDLAALPWLLRSRAFLIPLAVTIASSTLVTVTGGRDIVTSFLFAYFVQTPPIGGALIAGFLAPRASWLLGFIISFIAAIGYTIFILSVTTGTPDEGIAATGAARGVPGVADPRRALRGRRGVVPPVPAALEPEPRAPGRGQAVGGRPLADQRHREGPRQALVAPGQPRRRIPA